MSRITPAIIALLAVLNVRLSLAEEGDCISRVAYLTAISFSNSGNLESQRVACNVIDWEQQCDAVSEREREKYGIGFDSEVPVSPKRVFNKDFVE